MKNLAIIPARGGSKRIPGKNIKAFLGKPIIAYSIEAALKSGLFDEVMVSTDDEAIAEMAKIYGAKVPFFRSPKNADDFATTAEVLVEVIDEYKRIDKHFAMACCLYPTAPFVTPLQLQNAHSRMIDEELDSIYPVVPFSYPIQRALRINDGRLGFVNPEFATARSQDLPKAYMDGGQFYFFQVDAFLKTKSLLMAKTGAMIISELAAQDIDNEVDWKLAEMKYKLINKQD
ncbi:pseudaminic acid cytidylyltransferase [Fulvivirgaceae bacterium LMO-SS25]